MNIGLLEDNASIINLITTMLEMAGHHVSVYTEGKLLLDTVFSALAAYDLFIIDLGLPGELSGFDVIQALQQTKPTGKLPIIVVSGASQQELTRIQVNHPSVTVVRKPFSMRLLLQLIEQRKNGSYSSP
jgi:DNA-binding response OmpR family regulator